MYQTPPNMPGVHQSNILLLILVIISFVFILVRDLQCGQFYSYGECEQLIGLLGGYVRAGLYTALWGHSAVFTLQMK